MFPPSLSSLLFEPGVVAVVRLSTENDVYLSTAASPSLSTTLEGPLGISSSSDYHVSYGWLARLCHSGVRLHRLTPWSAVLPFQ